MVNDPETVWIGLEYFCSGQEDMWQWNDQQIIAFALDELENLQFIDRGDVLDATMLRVPKAYPAYFGTYAHFDIVSNYLSQIENLFCIGRNGMHRYNNTDHSMLTAIKAVDLIAQGKGTKAEIWDINTGDTYHEER